MAGAGIRNGYILELSEKDKEVAKQELGEDPTQIKSHVETLRTAIHQMKHLSIPTDDAFLLAFLRHAKFSQLRARKVLDNHVRNRSTDPFKQIFTNGTEITSAARNLIQKGAVLVLPSVVDSGPRTIMYRPALVDTTTETLFDVMTALMVSIEIAMLDPAAQINGLQYLDDRRECSISQYALITPNGMRVSVSAFISAMPVRYKNIIFYKAATVMNWAVALIKSLVSSKLASRIFTSYDEETLHTQVDSRVLPEELGGGAGTYEELSDRWFKHVQKHLSYFEKFSSVSYDASKKVAADTDDLEGAFRKLTTE